MPRLRHLAYVWCAPQMVTVTSGPEGCIHPTSNGTTRPQPPGADINRQRRLLTALGAAVVLAAGIIIGATQLHGHQATQPVAYTNVSRNFKTCLLTTAANGEYATPIWAAIQSVTQRKPINVQHIIAPPGTIANLATYLNSLLALHCQLVITAGPDLVPALSVTATAHPHQSFANISTTGTNEPNIHDLSGATPDDINQLLDTVCRC